MEDAEIRAALSQIKPGGRDILRRLLISDQFERDRYTEALLRSGPTGVTEAAGDLNSGRHTNALCTQIGHAGTTPPLSPSDSRRAGVAVGRAVR